MKKLINILPTQHHSHQEDDEANIIVGDLNPYEEFKICKKNCKTDYICIVGCNEQLQKRLDNKTSAQKFFLKAGRRLFSLNSNKLLNKTQEIIKEMQFDNLEIAKFLTYKSLISL